MSTPPEREQNWYPVSRVGWFTAHIQEGIAVTGDQAGDLVLFQNQADRWKATPGLTAAQQADVAGYEAAVAQLRQVNSDVLAAADQLTRTTIEAVLARSDLELGLEALLRGWQ